MRLSSKRLSSRQGRLTAVIAVLVLVLAACGGGDTEEDTGDATDEAAAEEEEDGDDAGSDEQEEEAPEAEEEEASSDSGDDTAEEAVSLEGETISFVVPYSPGGGYDTYVRMMVPYLEDILGATFVVENETGAGAALATNNTYTASPDELRLQIVDVVGSVANQLGEVEGIRFDLNEMTWLGTIQGEGRVVITALDSDFQSWEQIVAQDPRQPLFGMAGPGAHTFTTYSVLQEVFELPDERVVGLEGTGPTMTALLAGDIEASIRSVSSSAEEIEAGEVTGVVTVARERDPSIPDVPTVYEFDMTGDVGLLDAHVSLFEVSRSIAGPPGMDPGVRDVIRDAVWETLNDDDFLADAEEAGRPIVALNGSDTEDRIRGAIAEAPPEYSALIRAGFEDFADS